MRDLNLDEVADFARLTLKVPLSVRFIEYMPLGSPAGSECGEQGRRGGTFVPETEMRAAIEAQLGPLQRLSPSREPGVGPAVMYTLDNGNAVGRLGFISAMSRPFCDSCNRLRLTAEGRLRSCLFDGGEIDLAPILRQSGSANARQAELASAMQRCVAMKPELHGGCGTDPMSRVGG
jgi:cyclic pyranopterin phosphate synthase